MSSGTMSTTLMNSRFVTHGLALAVIALLASCSGTGTSASASPSGGVEATQDPCDAETVELAALIASSADARLECFSGRTITFRAYVSGMTGAGTCAFSPIPGDGWLNLCGGEQRLLVAEPGDEEALTAYIPPDMDEAPDFDQWVEVTGHFDDPAAKTCDREAPDGPAEDPDQVEACRRAFVLESVVPAQ